MALVWSFLANLLTFAVLLHAQPGFISIDCGTANDSNVYIENDITYISDAQFIETGVNEDVRINREELLRLYRTVRSFPNGNRNCYRLGSVNKSNKYLIITYFMYEDYDGKNSTPKFDLYIGANRWGTISFSAATEAFSVEIIIVATMNFVSVCLVNTGYGTPFISGLELRQLTNSMYGVVNETRSLQRLFRYDVGRSINTVIRYPDDSFDRIWWPKEDASWTPFSTLQNVTNKDKATEPPSTVMMTAVCPLNNSDALYFNWTVDDSSQQLHVYMHFAELELLGPNMTREFTACCGNNPCYNSPIRPEYLVTTTVQTPQPLTGQYNYSCSIKKTPTSTLPPILNAIEIFTILQLTEKPTREEDVEAMVDIKATYKTKRNWMGDPCLPEIYKWEGLTCNNNQLDAPAVVSLNISSAGLKGKIAASLANLKSIQSLDLSWNNLIGPVPNFLGDLPFLSSLNLSGNQLSGLIPSNLIEKSKKGSLKLSLDGNPDLCVTGSCSRHSSKRKITILSAASVASVVLILSILLIILRRFKWRKEVLIVEANRMKDLQLSENRRLTITEGEKKMATIERGRASWSNENKKIFIDLCIEEVQTGGRPGSHLEASSWKKIVTSFNQKTKLNYDHKQLKNMWDIMKKQYAAWKKLLNQTGIGYNEDTHIVTMEPERWEEYLKANPDAKVFRTKPLQFPKEMAIIFGGTMATGEAAWTPASGTIPYDMLRMPSENHNLSFASNPMSPQSSNFQEEDQEIELEDQLVEVRRKRPCPSRRKKDSGNDALVVSIDNLVSSIDSTFKTDGPTIAECIASLKKFPNVPDSLYIYALNAFRIKENREVWMSEDDDRIRIMWLKANADGGFVA